MVRCTIVTANLGHFYGLRRSQDIYVHSAQGSYVYDFYLVVACKPHVLVDANHPFLRFFFVGMATTQAQTPG